MNVLLVDDEEVALRALKRRVDWESHDVDEVFTAGSMQEAQLQFQQQCVDILISDIEMPQGSGLDLFEWVKTYYPEVECIYVTCHPEFDIMRRALQLGSADYLLKPIDYAELGGVLDRIIERKRSHHFRERIPEPILERLSREDRERSSGDDTVETVKRYIHEHIQEEIRIADLAGQVFLNEQYLSRLFKRVTGEGLLEFITSERLRLAKELLRSTDYPINRVADAVGYSNYSYFTRIFKRSEGLSPQAYRAERQ